MYSFFQNLALDKKVSTVVQKNENLEKMLKEIAAQNQKVSFKDDLANGINMNL